MTNGGINMEFKSHFKLNEYFKRSDEKAAIIFVEMKKQKNKISYSSFLSYWRKWREDFKLSDGSICPQSNKMLQDKPLNSIFKKIYDYYYQTWKDKTLKEMRIIRNEFKNKDNMPIQIYNIAQKKGYNVFKANSARNKYRNSNKNLSGFIITKKSNGKPVLGNNYELTLDDVKKFLGIKKNYVYNNPPQ